jgi:hypothetical protein
MTTNALCTLEEAQAKIASGGFGRRTRWPQVRDPSPAPDSKLSHSGVMVSAAELDGGGQGSGRLAQAEARQQLVYVGF